MGLETGTYIDSLVATNPVGATDPKSQGDDHIRLLKSTILATFPNISGEMSMTHTQLNNAAVKTEANVFTSAASALNRPVKLQSALPLIGFDDTDHTADNRLWDLGPSNADFRLRALNDAGTTAGNIIVITRSANTATALTLTANTITLTAATSVELPATVRMSSTGDVVLTLEADTDNSGEGDNPAIVFSQDGDTVTANMGLAGTGSVDALGTAITGGGGSNAWVFNYDGADNEITFAIQDVVKFEITSTQIVLKEPIETPNTDADEAGFKGAPHNEQNGNYTLVLADAGKRIYKASGGAGETITIPANSSVAFPVGTIIHVVNDGGGNLTIAITTDTLEEYGGSTGSKTLADNQKAILEKVTTTLWKYQATG